MEKLKITIIVPCWNVEKYLDKCIESLINQTYGNLEIILVDDYSSDSTPIICDNWSHKDKRIKVIHKSRNEGLGKACNTGIELATGAYIVFCDSDDWVDSNMYSEMLSASINNNTEAVISGLKRVDEEGNPRGTLEHIEKSHLYIGGAEVKSLICDMIASVPCEKKERLIQASAKVILYKKTIIDKHNLRFYSEREIPSEDLFFNMHYLSKCNRVYVLPNRYYNYRINPISITQELKKDIFQKHIVLYKKLIEECRVLNMGSDAELRAMRMFIGYVRVYCCNICNSSWSHYEKKKQIDFISRHEIWNEIWARYPINVMPYTHRVYALTIKYNLFFIVSVLSKIRSKL